MLPTATLIEMKPEVSVKLATKDGKQLHYKWQPRRWNEKDIYFEFGDETKKLLINHFLEQNGVDEFDVSEKNGVSLFEAMAGVVKAHNEYCLAHKNEFIL